jgi:hypothetical protein
VGRTATLGASGVTIDFTTPELFTGYGTVTGGTGDTLVYTGTIAITSAGAAAVVGGASYTYSGFATVNATSTGGPLTIASDAGTGVLILNASGSGTISTAGQRTSFHGVTAIQDQGSAITVELPNASGLTVTISGTGANASVNTATTVLLEGFTTFDAFSGTTPDGTTFVLDGQSTVALTIVGNGSNTTIQYTGGAATLNATGTANDWTFAVGSAPATALDAVSTIENAGSLNSVDLPAAQQIFISGQTVSISSGGWSTALSGIDYLASGPNSTFFPDTTTGYTFDGTSGGNTLNFSGVSSTSGLVVCMGTESVDFIGAPCGSGAASDGFLGFSSIVGSPGNDTFVVGDDNLAVTSISLIGGGGTDTLSFAGSTAGVTINLQTSASVSAVFGGVTYSVSFTGFTNAIGSSAGNNTFTASTTTPGILVGGGNNNTFNVSGGTSIINGGAGTGNTLHFTNTSGAVAIDLTNSSYQETGGAGLVLVVLGTIQNVVLPAGGGDVVEGPGGGTIDGTGSSGTEVLNAGSGSGTTTLEAGSGTVTLIGGTGAVVMHGGTGVDTYAPGSGHTTINLASGVVTGILDFAGAPAGVDVNVSADNEPVQVPSSAAASSWPNLTLSLQSWIGGWMGSSVSGSFSGANGASILNVVGTGNGDVVIGSQSTSATSTFTSTGAATYFAGPGTNSITCSGPACAVDYALVAINATTGQGICANLSSTAIATSGTVTCDGGDPGTSIAANTVYKFGSGTTDTLHGVTEVIGSTVSGSTNGFDTLVAGSPGQTLIAGKGSYSELYASAAGGDTLDGSNAANVDLWGGTKLEPCAAYPGVYSGGGACTGGGGQSGSLFGLVSGAGNNTFIIGAGTDTVWAQDLQYNASIPLSSAIVTQNDTIVSTVAFPSSSTIYGDRSDTVMYSGAVVDPSSSALSASLYWIANVATVDGNKLEDENVMTIIGQGGQG